MVTRAARQTPVGARPNKRREAVLFDQDAAGRLLEGAGDRVPREMIIRSSSLRQNPAYRPGNSPHRSRWLLLLSVAVACRTRVPEQVITPARPAPAPAEDVPRAWAPHADFLVREYRVEQRARVVATIDSATPPPDSTSLLIDASVRQATSGGMSGLLRSVVVAAPGMPAATLPGLVLPYAFTAPESPASAQYSPVGRPAAQDPCTSTPHVPLGAIRDLLIRIPEALTIGRQWSDTGSFVTCRDGVRLDVFSRREFRVAGYERRGLGGVLHITRSGQTALHGTSVRGDDTTHVDGAGTSSMSYDVDPITGAIVSASGTGTLDVVVRGATKSQRAQQSSSILVFLRLP